MMMQLCHCDGIVVSRCGGTARYEPVEAGMLGFEARARQEAEARLVAASARKARKEEKQPWLKRPS